ncbi:MAG: HIT family protein [Bacteroidota bacterium]
MASIFTQIIQGTIPGHIVAEHAQYLALLDIHPIARGHTLVIPKQEVDYLFDLDDSILRELLVFAKRVACGIQQVVPCRRVGVAVVGLEVPHAHVHLVPINSTYDIDFSKPPLKLTQEELATVAAQIKAAIKY